MRLTVVIVSFNSGKWLHETLTALERELGDGDEAIVFDNASADGTADLVAREAPWVSLIRSPENLGFAVGCNRAASSAGGDLLLFLNPDAVPATGALQALRAGAERWDVWQGLLTQDDGATVNSAGGELNYLGFGWAGDCDRPVTPGAVPREVAFASGACLMVRREIWERLGGFSDAFFMYCEDVDLALRARLIGGRVGIEPAAVFHHRYTFGKGAAKWRLLERNRWFTILRTYPRSLLAALLPALIALEPVLVIYAFTQRWGWSKLRAQGELVLALPRLLRERRHIQRQARVTNGEFLAAMRPDLDSPYFGRLGRAGAVSKLLGAGWALLQAVTR